MADNSTPGDELILNIEDLRVAATKKLPKFKSDFFNSGSTTQITINENSTAFSKYRIRPRVLVNVSKADTSTNVFGSRISFPLCVSPAGLHAMAHPDGELATSRACAAAGIHMGVSSYANYPVGDIVAAGRGAATSTGQQMVHMMQLYTMKDRVLQEQILQRAEAAGCKAVLLTADSPVLGVRWNELRNKFQVPDGLECPNIGMTKEAIAKRTHEDGFKSFTAEEHSWEEEIPWLRARTKMEIWIKGVLTAEDVVLAREWGCDGVIVSNHGGRQLDGTPATIDVLRECVEAAEGRIPIHVDGGFRTGGDIFKALALGAQCCWIGRPVIWGLAYDGQNGVEMALKILYDDFRRCMMLAGCKNISEISRAHLGVVRLDGPFARL